LLATRYARRNNTTIKKRNSFRVLSLVILDYKLNVIIERING